MTTNNHPAHGNVSLDRLHQIREILSKASAQSDGGNLGYAMADAVKVIDEAIAEFGAEPVAYMRIDGDDVEYNGHNEFSGGGKGAPLYAATPAAVVPSEMVNNIDNPYGDEDLIYEQGKIEGWNACRAAMLQGIQPVSNRDELPLGYLQGHKDGLEWAAQLAEANHPQTGDWLYDDPIDLAKAIRKGPHMPELKLVPADADDNFYSWFGRFWHENYQQNNYTTSAKQMLGTIAEFAFRAGRESATQAGNSPVTPDGYVLVPKEISCAMDDAAWEAYHETRCMSDIWAALLAAAPQKK
ncbi:hypothetical protein NMD09_18345 [Citrobacter portucalensis]|uniref:hypothetical protein n=1 Tax=Citrobacter portucalensis TaxID=1639133 RepID=UPI00351CC77D